MTKILAATTKSAAILAETAPANGRGERPISHADAVAVAREDGYTMAGATGSIALRTASGELVGTYHSSRGALRALVAHATGRVNPERRAPQPRARYN